VNIMREVEGSLRRLQTDYIDLYQGSWLEQQHAARGDAAQRSTILCARERFAISAVQLNVMASGHCGHVARSTWGWRST